MAAWQFFEPESLTAPSGLAFADIAAAGTKGSTDTKLAAHGSSESSTVTAESIEY